MPIVIPHTLAIRSWKQADIGGALPGGQRLTGGSLQVFGSGSDIFNRHDAFHFFYEDDAGNFDLSATVEKFLWSNRWAKAGVMLRSSNRANSAFAMVNVFPFHAVAWACRSKTGGSVSQNMVSVAGFPVQVKLARKRGVVRGYYRIKTGPWIKLGSTTAPAAAAMRRLGFAVLSHNPFVFTRADFADIKIRKSGAPTQKFAWHLRGASAMHRTRVAAHTLAGAAPQPISGP